MGHQKEKHPKYGVPFVSKHHIHKNNQSNAVIYGQGDDSGRKQLSQATNSSKATILNQTTYNTQEESECTAVSLLCCRFPNTFPGNLWFVRAIETG